MEPRKKQIVCFGVEVPLHRLARQAAYVRRKSLAQFCRDAIRDHVLLVVQSRVDDFAAPSLREDLAAVGAAFLAEADARADASGTSAPT